MWNWLKGLFRKDKPRIYLGTLAVVPRSDFKRHFEEVSWRRILDFFGSSKTEDLDTELHTALADLFALPPVASREQPKDSDLALDVVIPKFQGGEFLPVDVGQAVIPFIPFMWRPKVTVAARLVHIDSGQTRAAYVLTQKLEWMAYFKRILSLEDFFWESRGESLFTANDTRRLFYMACIRVLEKLRKHV